MEDRVNETTVLQTILLAKVRRSYFFALEDAVEGFLRGVEAEREVDFFTAGLDFLAAGLDVLAAADEDDFLAGLLTSTGSSA